MSDFQRSVAFRKTGAKLQSVQGVKLHSFAESGRLADKIAGILRLECAPIEDHLFPDGETRIRVQPPGGHTAVVVRSFVEPNAKLVEVLFAADALRRAGTKRIILVAPYLPYMRQDAVFNQGEAISQRVIGALLSSGYDRVLTLEPHLHRITKLSEVFECPARSLSAAPAIAEYLRERSPVELIIGPDEESKRLVREVARINRIEWVIAEKHRLGDRSVQIKLPLIPSGLRRAALIDDIASSGATLAAIARELSAIKIATECAIVVHALFAGPAVSRMRKAGIRKIISCNTITHPTNQIEVAPIFADALRTLTR